MSAPAIAARIGLFAASRPGGDKSRLGMEIAQSVNRRAAPTNVCAQLTDREPARTCLALGPSIEE